MAVDAFIFATEVWTDQPGGKVVKRFTYDGEKYVYVEFEKSPGRWYLYYANE